MAERTLPHRPALDGVRALAVLAVLLYHGDVPWTQGGFLGVDLFFVLSGFLITSLLLREHEVTGRLDLGRFWARRARRLLPALGVLLVVVMWVLPLAGVVWGQRVRGDAIATLVYVSNWRFILTGQSYVDQYAGPSPLLHTWSLAIEEQWYLVFPLIALFVLSRPLGRRYLPWILGLGVAGSALLTMVLQAHGASLTRLYYGTDTRLQAILVGALAASLIGHRVWDHEPGGHRGAWYRSVSLPGFAVLVPLLVLARPESAWLYQGGLLLVATASVLVVVGVAAEPDASGPTRWLGWRPLVLLGTISYGVYLWHWPVYVVLDAQRTGLSAAPLLALRILVTLAAATGSYLLVERPVRRGSLPQLGPMPAEALLDISAAVVILAVLVPLPGKAVPSSDSIDALAKVAASLPSTAPQAAPPSPKGTAIRSVVLVGDSQALSLYAGIKDDPSSTLTVRLVTRLGCGVVPYVSVVGGQPVSPQEPLCDDWAKARGSEIANAAGDLGVLFAGSWEQYDRWVDGRAVPYTDPEWMTLTVADYRTVLAEILHSMPHAAVVLDHCHDVPNVDIPASTLFQWGRYPPVVNDPGRIAATNRAVETAASYFPAVTVVDVGSLLCAHGYQASVDGVQLRTDGLHWTTEGARLVWRWMEPKLVAGAGVP